MAAVLPGLVIMRESDFLVVKVVLPQDPFGQDVFPVGHFAVERFAADQAPCPFADEIDEGVGIDVDLGVIQIR